MTASSPEDTGARTPRQEPVKEGPLSKCGGRERGSLHGWTADDSRLRNEVTAMRITIPAAITADEVNRPKFSSPSAPG